MGVIFITHDLAVVADIADRILVMYKGEIVEQGNCKRYFAIASDIHIQRLCLPAGPQATKRKTITGCK